MPTSPRDSRNARLAGAAFFFYIATSMGEPFVYARASDGAGVAARLASIAHHAPAMELAIMLAMLKIVYALILAVTLYELTRDVDRGIALLAFTCRVVEGVTNAVPAISRIGLLSIATGAAPATMADSGAQQAEAALLLSVSGWSLAVAGTIFAVGSTLFAYLFLRGRSIPAPLAWLGVIGSLLIIPLFPLQGVGLAGETASWILSTPILLFESILAFWLLTRGVVRRADGGQHP